MSIVPFLDALADEVHDLVPTGHEHLRDQPPVTALPGSFGAHEARGREREYVVQGFLPRGRAHLGRIARELSETREELLARFLAAPPAELDGMLVRDAGVRERSGQRRLVNCGLRRDEGKRLTSTRVWTPASPRQVTSSSTGRRPCPIVWIAESTRLESPF